MTTLTVFLITAFWPQISSFIFPNTTLGLYDKSFWENVLVEAHGLVFDMLLIGLALVWMDTHRQKRESITRNLENLWDFNTLTDEIYQKRKVNIIKRLNEHKVYKISVTDLTFQKVELKSAIFTNSGLYGFKLLECPVFELEISNSKLNSADFSGSRLKNSKITDTYLKNAIFRSTVLVGLDFQGSDLFRAKFINANLESSNLRKCNLKRTVFTGANLKNANIKGCINIDYDALLEAKNIDYIKADSEVVKELKRRKPEMKVNLVR